MSDTTWADRVAAATRHSTPRQVGAIPVLYPLLEAMQVRETINTLRWTKADVDLGRLVEVLTLNRLADIRSHLNRGRYIRRENTAHQVALAQRGNPAKGLVVVELTGEDRQLALAFQVDRVALSQAQALDGKYLLGTNAPQLSAEEALTWFKAQDGVEKQNRTLKGPLQVQPCICTPMRGSRAWCSSLSWPCCCALCWRCAADRPTCPPRSTGCCAVLRP